MTNQEEKNYLGQNFNKTVLIDGNIETNPKIAIIHYPFLLQRHDFEKIISGGGILLNLINIFLGAASGLFINMIAKLIGSRINNKIIFDEWEFYAFIIALILMIICYIVYLLVPNKKRSIIEKIEQHFENS